MRRTVPGLLASLALVVSVADVGCDEKKTASETGTHDDAGADKYATADPKLEKALQAPPSAGSEHGPPAQGVFAPGAADQRHPAGAPTTVDLVSEGDEPRVSLAVSLDASAQGARELSYGPAIMELGMQMGPRAAMPTIDLNLVLGPSKKDDGGDDWLIADVRRSIPAKEQYGQLPPGSEKDIASLEGTQIRLKVTLDGRASDEQMALAKAARPELGRMVQNAAEALVLLIVPLPPKPVGAGAQWIAETRMPWWGVDVIVYRAYRVKGLEGGRVSLTVDAQAYATTQETELQGVPKGATLEQFEAQAQGEMELVRGESLPRKAALEQRAAMYFQSPNAPPPSAAGPGGEPQSGMLGAKFQGQATFVRGDDLRAASRR